MSAQPAPFQNFPLIETWSLDKYDFLRIEDLGQFDFFSVGHDAPYALDNVANGRITLGSGSANAQDYVQLQKTGLNILFNQTNKTLEFVFNLSLSSATLTECVIGIAPVNTNLLGSNIANGFGFYCNLSGGPATGNWYTWMANGSATQFTGYTQSAVNATDTNQHTFSIMLTTDGTTLGAGSLVYYIDGAQVGVIANTGANVLPYNTPMSLSVAMGNGSGVAQSLLLYEISSIAQR